MSVLRLGDEGPEVEALQTELTAVGCACDADGIFGAGTEQAVINFQNAFSLDADGVVGHATRAALQKAIADKGASNS